MDSSLAVCIKTTLPIQREVEDRMITHLWMVADKQHRDMGGIVGSPGSYVFGSWLWLRMAWQQRYENDFSDRLALPPQKGGELYRLSNKSLNFPKQFVRMHHAGATADLGSYAFFAVAPEGGEDEHPALPLWERYLRERAKRMDLGQKLKNESARPMLIRGEVPYKVHAQRQVRIEPRTVHAVRDPAQPGDMPLKDSKGNLVTELDVWVPDPVNPQQQTLERDPALWWRAEVPKTLTQRTFQIEHVVQSDAGATIDFIHPADFVFEINQPTLDHCNLTGQFYRIAVDDLFDRFDKKDITPAGEEFRQKYGVNSAASGYTSAAEAAKVKQGENADTPTQLTDTGVVPRRLFFEGYWRYDWNNDGRREYVYCLIDWETKTPIAYDPTHLVLGSQTRTNPYGMGSVARKQHRCYGEGIFETFEDLADSSDQSYNRIFIEQQTSGKVTMFDPSALEQTYAGGPLKLRGPTLWKKRDGTKSTQEIVDTAVIPAETGELRANLGMDIQTMTSRGGGVSPGEAESSGLQGAQTATGLQILERQKGKLDRSLEDDINNAHRLIIQQWAQVEADVFDPKWAEQLFQGKTVPMPNPDFAAAMAAPPPEAPISTGDNGDNGVQQGPDSEPSLSLLASVQIPETIEVPAVQVLADWLKTIPRDQMMSYIKLVLVQAKEQEVAARADNRVRLVQQFAQMPPMLQSALLDEYAELLALNGSTNPERTLQDIMRATAEMAQAQAEAAALAGSGAPGLPPGEEERPVTGRPDAPAEPMI